jgi:hypothetical protein
MVLDDSPVLNVAFLEIIPNLAAQCRLACPILAFGIRMARRSQPLTAGPAMLQPRGESS